jgi:GNAT superfamily N-acetyltransferase
VGYTTLSWVDRVPPDFHDEMAELIAAMSTDAPHGDSDFEPEQWDAERYRAWEDGQLARGRQRLVSVVRHDASGQLAGFTDLGRAATIPDVAFQWATIVRKGHRGHKLGMLLKLANLEQLRREVPTVRHLNTWNAEDNTWMVAVNESVGFTVMEAWTKYELVL